MFISSYQTWNTTIWEVYTKACLQITNKYNHLKTFLPHGVHLQRITWNTGLTTSKGHIWIKEIVLPQRAHQVSQITANASELFTTWCTMNHLKHSVSTTWSVLGRVRKFAFRQLQRLQLQLQRLPISKFISGSQLLHDEQKMNGPIIFSPCEIQWSNKHFSVNSLKKWNYGCSFADWTLSPDFELSCSSKQLEVKECKSCRRLYKQTAPCAVFLSAPLPLGGHMGGWQGGQGQDMGNAWIICL